ncbi:guanine nucleotide-binding protein subunit alpha [Neocallimastix californiae]|uniref:Guanine nucleotide-binding protein subunit alpha n=1 Tax=Neocallimastix californiae TaxID=1754190 RepID=A0A1Y2FIY5_9FUNG|nr:guanine nucleotide-binding protein subunit alpha [Neocallimastix californiae]|eukprot:ORY83942.1 guanine nucleotide-binding protein subunit alpha [Neocallimastix californiae]
MGCCMSSPEDKEGKRINDDINNQLIQEKMRMRSEVKMLLLGAGESGKSTILKQRSLFMIKSYFRSYAKYGISLQYPQNQENMAIILDLPNQIEDEVLPARVADAVNLLWKDAGVQACYERSREYQLNDSAKYYFESIDRIRAPNYIPTDQDVLRSRVKTTGITETTFHIKDLTYRMFDVGGQRSERKKWIHCFENVTAIIFMVAISEYDQVLVEDETVNRMQEALTLFDSICNSRWFVKTSIILFLNKIDLFREKLSKSPMGKYFQDYVGGDDYDSACQYILNRFVALNHTEPKQIYTHFTCATDTTQIKFVMAAVNDIIIQTNLRDCGLM